MALIRLAFSRFLPCSGRRREAAWSHPLPTAIHNRHGPVREKAELPHVAGVRILEIPNAYEEGAMRLPIDRQSSPLPKRFPVGARYVVEGRGGEDGHLRVFSRYIVLPGGQRINVPSDPSQCGAKFGAMSGHAPRGKRGSNRARPSRTATKKIMRGAGTIPQHRN
jgi:hypothetical protein